MTDWTTSGDTEALAMAKDASRSEHGEPIPEETSEPVLHKLTVAVAA